MRLKLYKSGEAFLRQQQTADFVGPELGRMVSRILATVRRDGDQALFRFTSEFDEVKLAGLRVPSDDIDSAVVQLDSEFRAVLEQAADNIRKFHRRQVPDSHLESAAHGTRLGMQFTALQRIGCYIPGGQAGYPSTVFMTVIPAQVAGVREVAIVSPPSTDGLPNRLVLAAAGMLGVREIYAAGGAQAIGALAFGTESIPAVHKIFGPGNAYVNEAKRQVFGFVGIDSLAGPTELAILADEHANPEYVVRDLFAQAEHDRDTRVTLVTTSRRLAKAVRTKVKVLLQSIERRDIVAEALEKHGALVLVPDLDEGVEVVNQIAPEHLEILTSDPGALLPRIKHTGAICLGEFSPAVVGDYWAGPNHVLPTGKSSRFASPLNVRDFMKFSSVIDYSRAQFQASVEKIARFAEAEGLPNHREAVLCRQ